MTRRLVVFGRTGQLATALAAHSESAGWRTRFIDRTTCDFSKLDTLHEALSSIGEFDIAINAVAYNDVDEAERDAGLAERVNAEAPKLIARHCAERQRPFLHVSTDFVFPGRPGGQYDEGDTPAPLNAYGHTKRAGERAVLEAWNKHAVFRTAWVYSATHRNFLTAMLNQIGRRDTVQVVSDQIGSPTSTTTLANGLLLAANRILSDTVPGGLYHLCDRGAVSRSAFASEIYRLAASRGAVPTVTPISAAGWPSPAKRPGDASLNCQHFETAFNSTLPHWRDSLECVVSSWRDADISAPASP